MYLVHLATNRQLMGPPVVRELRIKVLGRQVAVGTVQAMETAQHKREEGTGFDECANLTAHVREGSPWFLLQEAAHAGFYEIFIQVKI